MSNIKRYIGLSLSSCIRDILDEKIDTSEISGIITSTRFLSVDEVLDYYYNAYWSNHKRSEVKAVLTKFWPIIFQPRLAFKLEENVGHVLSHGWWVDTFEGRVFKYFEP
jgi:hypothetical protein